MAGKLFSNSVVVPVYFTAGKNNGQEFFRRAPFEVLLIDGKQYLQPRSYGARDAALGLLGNDSAEAKANWRQDFGLETLQRVVVGEHEMGDNRDSWVGMSRFSNI